MNTEIASDLGDRLPGLQHHLHGLSLELRAEPTTTLWHEPILSDQEDLSKIIGTPQIFLVAFPGTSDS